MNRIFSALGKLANIIHYLRNPQENPRIAAVALGIIVVIGLIVVAFLVLLYLRASGSVVKKPIKKRLKRSAKRWAIVLSVCVFAGLLLVTAQSRSPKFCVKCHINQDTGTSWKKSKHSSVACYKCHQSPGVSGFSVYMIRGLSNVTSYFNKSWQEPVKTNVSNSACLKCHKKIESETVNTRGLLVSHKEFLSKGQRCTECHAGTGHDNVSNPFKSPQMEQCLSCHNGEKASAACNTCHVVDIAKSAKGYQRTYAKANLGETMTCKGCHTIKTEQNCIKCMGFEMPHPEGWGPQLDVLPESRQKPIHPAVAFKNFEKCMKCHSTAQFCNKCHRFPADNRRNHGPEWLQNHKQMPRNSTCGCHNPEKSSNWCEYCHGTNFQRKNPGDTQFYHGPAAE